MSEWAESGFDPPRCVCGDPLDLVDLTEVMAPNMNFRSVPFVVAIAACRRTTCCDMIFQRRGRLRDH